MPDVPSSPQDRKLVLGSSSPYRRDLLSRLKVPFDVAVPEVDETPRTGEAPRALALRLALAKAHAVAARFPDAVHDVIVVDGGGFNDHALIGELMSARAEQRGVGGMVIWGAIRDSAELKAGSFPVYASGVTHRGPYKNGPGEINVPITIGGIPVNPGDIMVGDADGLVAVPQEHAQEILASAKAILAKEEGSMKQIRAGTVDRSWVDKALREKGYKV